MYCILVSGIPAAGKSTFANQLSQKMKLTMISKDSIKELFYDHFGFHSREEKVLLGTTAADVMYYIAEQMMKVQQPFILENNFEAATRDSIASLIHQYGYTPIMVHLTGEYDKIYQRFIERDKTKGRHPGHVTNKSYTPFQKEVEAGAPITKEQFIASIQSRGMDEPVMEGPRIIVDTTDVSLIDLDKICKSIVENINLYCQNMESGLY